MRSICGVLARLGADLAQSNGVAKPRGLCRVCSAGLCGPGLRLGAWMLRVSPVLLRYGLGRLLPRAAPVGTRDAAGVLLGSEALSACTPVRDRMPDRLRPDGRRMRGPGRLTGHQDRWRHPLAGEADAADIRAGRNPANRGSRADRESRTASGQADRPGRSESVIAQQLALQHDAKADSRKAAALRRQAIKDRNKRQNRLQASGRLRRYSQ
jgi:hypothetical protein